MRNGKRELLEMRYVPGSIEVQVGQSFIRPVRKEFIRPGLKVGEIVEVCTRFGDRLAYNFYQTEREFNSMQEVAVLLYEPPLRQKYEKSLPNAVKDDKGKSKKPTKIDLL